MSTIVIDPSKKIETAKLRVWFALRDLELARGDRGMLELIWSRLIIGQELARAYFSGNVAEHIADATLVTRGLLKRLKDQRESAIKGSAGQVEIIRLALRAIDDMIAMTTAKERSDIRLKAAKAMEKEFPHV